MIFVKIKLLELGAFVIFRVYLRMRGFLLRMSFIISQAFKVISDSILIKKKHCKGKLNLYQKVKEYTV